MSYESTKGLQCQWQGIGYGKGWYAIPGTNGSLGAVTVTAPYDYTARAKELAAAAPGEFVFVGIGPGGSSVKVTPVGTRDELDTLYDQASTDPTRLGYAYAAMFRKSESADPVDEAHFTGIQVIESWFSKDKLKQLAPWIVGGAVLIAGAIYLTRAKKGRATGKRRAGSSGRWRRKSVTVWR